MWTLQGIIYRTLVRLHPLLPAPPVDMYMYVYMHMRRDMLGLREPMVLSALKYSGPPAYCRQQNRPTPTGRGNATCRRTQFEGALFFF